MQIQDTKEYSLVKEFYKDKKAARSGVPYMNHIDEGIILCNYLGYDPMAVGVAFCLHPLFQDDKAVVNIYETLCNNDDFGIDPYVIVLAMEYRSKANGYLSNKTKEVKDISLSPIEHVNQMLVIDKVQNRKDFEKYHKGTHPRSEALDQYFKNWLERLGISEEKYQELKALIS